MNDNLMFIIVIAFGIRIIAHIIDFKFINVVCDIATITIFMNLYKNGVI